MTPKKIYPEHFVSWALSLATLIAMLYGGGKVVYYIGQWTNTVTANIQQLQQGQAKLEGKIDMIQAQSSVIMQQQTIAATPPAATRRTP